MTWCGQVDTARDGGEKCYFLPFLVSFGCASEARRVFALRPVVFIPFSNSFSLSLSTQTINHIHPALKKAQTSAGPINLSAQAHLIRAIRGCAGFASRHVPFLKPAWFFDPSAMVTSG